MQIAPEISPGSGVAGVAYELERALTAAGAHVERFTRAEAGGHAGTAPRSRLGHAWDVVWFSTAGTRRAKAFLAARPGAVSICHNDALVGDLYVNHGLLQAAMRARGHYVWRMVRNPLHLFTAPRDRRRYRGDYHRLIIALTPREAALLTETYGRVRAPIEVIPNGVDVARFRLPPSTSGRPPGANSASARQRRSRSSSATSSTGRACRSRSTRSCAPRRCTFSSSAARPR